MIVHAMTSLTKTLGAVLVVSSITTVHGESKVPGHAIFSRREERLYGIYMVGHTVRTSPFYQLDGLSGIMVREGGRNRNGSSITQKGPWLEYTGTSIVVCCGQTVTETNYKACVLSLNRPKTRRETRCTVEVHRLYMTLLA